MGQRSKAGRAAVKPRRRKTVMPKRRTGAKSAREDNPSVVDLQVSNLSCEPAGAREVEQHPQYSSALLAVLVQSIKDYAIFMLDKEGRIISWNSGAERIKGYTADEIVGQHFSCFY